MAEKIGDIDILINNAGISRINLFTDISEQEWDDVFDVNIKGMFLVTRAFLPGMIRRKYGKIINISSMWGVTGGSCEVHYSASKAAVIGFTKALAKEEGPSGINVNCIAPGVIETEMNAQLDDEAKRELCEETPLMRLGKPEEIANAALFLASDAASFITGQVICSDGGITI
jgi:3-oxoacyl-[acyl-carrier protein] reductase